MKAAESPSPALPGRRTPRLVPGVTPELCTGCEACAIACALARAGAADPGLARIRILRRGETASFLPVVCLQCEDPPCLPACPAGARFIAEKTGLVTLDPKRCIGCGACVQACPAGAVAMDPAGTLALSCDACGGEPACVAFCESGALRFAPPHVAARRRMSTIVRLNVERIREGL
jgi:Fe-S-cluster-containing dehydrogenase component